MESVEQLLLIQRRLGLCQRHHLTHAANHVCEELAAFLQELPYEITRLQQSLPNDRRRDVLPLRELVAELGQLETEFGRWRHRPDQHTLCVTTEPIELEGIVLGRFEIQLDLDQMVESHGHVPYRIVALDPNPPTSNDVVTHPHVRDERLCEGDASVAIRATLEEGRICDFFLLVRSVLQTYNPDSPFVRLENWFGTPCYECGGSVDDEDRYYCEACEHDFCSDCMGTCRSCDCSLCGECLSNCILCGDSTCSDCLKRCVQCGKRVCESCREDELCSTCQEAMENNDETNEEQPSDAPGSAHPAGEQAA